MAARQVLLDEGERQVGIGRIADDRRVLLDDGYRQVVVDVGVEITGSDLRTKYDAVILAIGATNWRDLPVPGRELNGIYQAMEFLPWGNKQALGEIENPDINVAGKHVVILGGGDTGADCLGTSIRQGAASITQLEIMPRPTEERPAGQPWPTYPMIYRVSSAHEENDNRVFAVSTEEFLGDGQGNLRAIKIVETQFVNGKFEAVVASEKEIPCDFVFMAMGFTGPEKSSLITQLEVELDDRGNIKRDCGSSDKLTTAQFSALAMAMNLTDLASSD